MEKSKVERVLCAAIWVDTGKEEDRRSYSYPKTGLVFGAWRHSDCFTTLNAWLAGLSDADMAAYGNKCHQGFITSTGRFVGRREASAIAFAAGQTNVDTGRLHSEDLY